MPDKESFTPLAFPVSGIDVSTEYERQPPQTTPAGQNVRTYEQLTQRGRGGSRGGLVQYVPALVGGAFLIQHINYIVDPQGTALLSGEDAAFYPAGTTFVIDPSTNNVNYGTAPPESVAWGPAGTGPAGPYDGLGDRNPGREVPAGGAGIGLNRLFYLPGGISPPSPPPPTGTIALLQSGGPFVNVASFGGNVTLGDLIVVGIIQGDSLTPHTGQTISLSDTLGNGYQQISGYIELPQLSGDPVVSWAMSLWYCFSQQSGMLTVTATADQDNAPGNTIYVSILEYSGVQSLDAFNAQDGNGEFYTSGFVGVNGLRELLIGWGMVVSNAGASPAGIYSFPSPISTTGFASGIGLNGPAQVQGDIGQAGNNWGVIGASFRPR